LKSVGKDFRIGLYHILHNKSLQKIMLLTALVNLVFGVVLATGDVVVTGRFKWKNAILGFSKR